MHQVRPLRRVPSVTVIYDTIPLRYGTNRPMRRLKRMFFRRVASTTREILTISEHSKASIVRDLGVAEERIEILRFPFDEDFVQRVHGLRRTLRGQDVALFLGGFLPHKNLPLLLAAFASTEFRRAGGQLVLAGGTAAQAEQLRDRLTADQRTFVEVREVCGQPDLDRLFATCLFLIQPSLEEGFGLPAWEALTCGLAVCASDGGALPEVVGDYAQPFLATSGSAMAAAIDVCAANARGAAPDDAVRMSQDVRRRAPTIRQFGDQFRRVVERHAGATRTT
jgi:glycosyltransferase involved in cell wall biosynthesis